MRREAYRFNNKRVLHPQNPTYKYYLEQLEDDCRKSYAEWVKDKRSSNLRYELFLSIEDLSFAVAQLTNIPKEHVNRRELAYELAIYIFERIINERLIPIGTQDNKRFPWQNYLRRSIKGFIPYIGKDANASTQSDFMSVYWENFVDAASADEDQELAAPGRDEHQPDLIIEKKYLQKQIVKGLHLFYTKKQINRLYYMFCSIMSYEGKNRKYPSRDPNMPQDLQEFALTVIIVAKRIVQSISIPAVKKASPESICESVSTAIRSTLFLAAVIERDPQFPRELVMCLDMDSLVRLCQSSGGKTIRIPTDRELHSLVQAASTAAEMLTTGYDKEETTMFSQFDQNHLPASPTVPLTPLINLLLQHHNIFQGTQSKATEPMKDILISSVESLDTLLDKLVSELKPEQYLTAYSALSTTVMNILKVLGQSVRNPDDKQDQTKELPDS